MLRRGPSIRVFIPASRIAIRDPVAEGFPRTAGNSTGQGSCTRGSDPAVEDYDPGMPEPSTIQACSRGHVLHYPSYLDELAMQTGQEIAFCAACDCGTVHFVVIWAGDRTRIMAHGGPELYDRFEATGWPEASFADKHGVFFYRTVANHLDIALFLKG